MTGKNTKLLSILVGFASMLVVVNSVLIGFVYMAESPNVAQASQNINLSANCKSLLSGGVALSNGKIITIDKNKTLGLVVEDLEMVNGTTLKSNGEYTTKDNETNNLENGQILDFQGNFIPAQECISSISNLDISGLTAVEVKTE